MWLRLGSLDEEESKTSCIAAAVRTALGAWCVNQWALAQSCLCLLVQGRAFSLRLLVDLEVLVEAGGNRTVVGGLLVVALRLLLLGEQGEVMLVAHAAAAFAVWGWALVVVVVVMVAHAASAAPSGTWE